MMVTEREREMTEYEFLTWFASKDLGALEIARPYLEADAIENGFGTEDVFATAKATVEMYLDDTEMADGYLGLYRSNGAIK